MTTSDNGKCPQVLLPQGAGYQIPRRCNRDLEPGYPYCKRHVTMHRKQGRVFNVESHQEPAPMEPTKTDTTYHCYLCKNQIFQKKCCALAWDKVLGSKEMCPDYKLVGSDVTKQSIAPPVGTTEGPTENAERPMDPRLERILQRVPLWDAINTYAKAYSLYDRFREIVHKNQKDDAMDLVNKAADELIAQGHAAGKAEQGGGK